MAIRVTPEREESGSSGEWSKSYDSNEDRPSPTLRPMSGSVPSDEAQTTMPMSLNDMVRVSRADIAGDIQRQIEAPPWTNHGEYVVCVVNAVQSFIDQGLLAQNQQGSIVRVAAQSDCGK